LSWSSTAARDESPNRAAAEAHSEHQADALGGTRQVTSAAWRVCGEDTEQVTR
jgi:hypothetical protein